MIKWTDSLVDGFSVAGWLTALFFSLIVSIVSSLLNGLVDKDRD